MLRFMRKSVVRIGCVLLMLVSHSLLADDLASNAENKFNEILKICNTRKKNLSVCECVVKNLGIKQRNGVFSETQLSDAVKAAQGGPDAPDYMADLMAGLEFHCLENPNYSD
jgi:hypothetical protein